MDSRLVTQNLLVSAAFAERHNKPDWDSVRNLSMLIDLYCLSDEVVVLGRAIASDLRNLDSRLFDLLTSTNFVRVKVLNDTEAKLTSACAKRHLLSFLGEEPDSEAFGPLL
jgi:hypothetical protein